MLRSSLIRWAATAITSTSTSTTTTSDDVSAAVTAEARATLHGLYRRLLACGEEGVMMQATLSTHGLKEAIGCGSRLLGHHRRLTIVDAEAQRTSALRHPLRRARLACQRRQSAWAIFWLRLRLRSKSAISNALVYGLFVLTCSLLYAIYRACRVGVNRAEERYRTMAIPIVQAFDALDAMEDRKRIMKLQMDQDIIRERQA